MNRVCPPFLLTLLLTAFLLPPPTDADERASPWNSPIRRLAPDSGWTAIYQRDGSSALTSICLLLRGGKRAEPPGREGSAYLTARLMLEIPDDRSARRLMVQASPLSAGSHGDFCLIEVETLSAHLEETLKILSRPLHNPLFSDIRLEALKRYMGHLRMRETDASVSLARSLLLGSFFGPRGYGASSYGTEDSLKKIRGRDLQDLYESWYGAENIVLAVVTDRGEEEVGSLLRAHFKPPRRGGPTEPRTPIPSPAPATELSDTRDTLQSLVGAAYLLPGASPKIFALASLAESLIGKGVSSRLWRLRQEGLLAYNILCNYLPFRDAGILETCLETDNDKLEAAADAFQAVLADVSTEGTDARELEAARLIALTEFLRDNEAKSSRARNMAVYEALGLGHDFLEAVPSLLAAVTPEEMNAFLAERLSPDKAARVVIKGTKKKEQTASPAGLSQRLFLRPDAARTSPEAGAQR
ncbi:MAG: insulinase family protein, partial [Candidatus Aminicenantes bacterium]|nr:insulinase family protein [Candidatus Aminicenantes bacterium]